MPKSKISDKIIIFSNLNATKSNSFCWQGDANNNSQIAEQLSLISVEKLDFRGKISAQGKNKWLLTGNLGATATQKCVVTLKEVKCRVDETYTLKFLNMITKEENFVAGVVRVPKDDLKIYIKENYFKCIGDGVQVRTEEDSWIFDQESASAGGAGGGESKSKRADFLTLIEDSGIKLTSFCSGTDREEIWNKSIKK